MHYNKHQPTGQEKACSGIAQLVVCLSPCQNGLLHKKMVDDCALVINPMAHGPPAQPGPPGPPGPPDHLNHLDHLLHLDHLVHLVHLDYLDHWTTIITTLTTLTTLII